MTEKTKTFTEMYNKKERLRVIKRGILSYLNLVKESRRGPISSKIIDLEMDENPYEVYRGGISKKILIQPSTEEIAYCLNYLKDRGLINYDENRKIWIITDIEGLKKKGPTLDDFLNND